MLWRGSHRSSLCIRTLRICRDIPPESAFAEILQTFHRFFEIEIFLSEVSAWNVEESAYLDDALIRNENETLAAHAAFCHCEKSVGLRSHFAASFFLLCL